MGWSLYSGALRSKGTQAPVQDRRCDAVYRLILATYADGGSTQTLWEERTPWNGRERVIRIYQSMKPGIETSVDIPD